MKRGILIAATLAAFVWANGAEAGAGEPVVVELYTSQGCDTCPPADAYLGELAQRDDVIALSLHVNYWDYIGWKDRFALPGNTDRQRRYARTFGTSYVYTPQIVVDGRGHDSNPAEADALIEEAVATDNRLDVRIERTPGGGLRAVVPADPDAPHATVWMALYDDKHTIDIRRGENAGRTLSYHNVVRAIVELGSYDGSEAVFDLTEFGGEAMGDRDGCAVVVQAEGQGPVLGAAKMALAQVAGIE